MNSKTQVQEQSESVDFLCLHELALSAVSGGISHPGATTNPIITNDGPTP